MLTFDCGIYIGKQHFYQLIVIVNNVCHKFNHVNDHFNHGMVDLLLHIETTQISKSNLLNLTVHLTNLVIFDYFSSNAHPHYNNHLMVISTTTFAVQNNPWWLN